MSIVPLSPAANQIRFEEPPPRRAAGIRTGFNVRLDILRL